MAALVLVLVQCSLEKKPGGFTEASWTEFQGEVHLFYSGSLFQVLLCGRGL